jgi:hypothetical protein
LGDKVKVVWEVGQLAVAGHRCCSLGLAGALVVCVSGNENDGDKSNEYGRGDSSKDGRGDSNEDARDNSDEDERDNSDDDKRDNSDEDERDNSDEESIDATCPPFGDYNNDDAEEFAYCSGCKMATYCSKACQQSDCNYVSMHFNGKNYYHPMCHRGICKHADVLLRLYSMCRECPNHLCDHLGDNLQVSFHQGPNFLPPYVFDKKRAEMLAHIDRKLNLNYELLLKEVISPYIL